MQFSLIRSLTLAVLAGSALALPAPIEDTTSLANVEVSLSAILAGNSLRMEKLRSEQTSGMVEKRSPVAIALISIIGGKLLSGAMSLGIERAKAALVPDEDTWKTFEDVSLY